MIIRTLPPVDGDLIVAHRGKVWALRPDDKSGQSKQILRDIGSQTGARFKDVSELQWYVKKERPDLLFGKLSGDVIDVETVFDSHFVVTSPLVRQTVQSLGLRGARSIAGDGNGGRYMDAYPEDAVKGEFPDVAYHGTCEGVMRSILRRGLEAQHPWRTNWSELNLPSDRVFLTFDQRLAMRHANRQAETYRRAPVVIATRIPDPAKVRLDYDVATTFHGSSKISRDAGYGSRNIPTVRTGVDASRVKKIGKYSPGTDFTKVTGVFAYKGRIPESMFKSITCTMDRSTMFSNATGGVAFASKKEFLKALESLPDRQ